METTFAKPIIKGSVVKFGDGYYRVTARFKESVNLGAIFGGHIHHKKVPIADVEEAHDEWYALWQKSESYQSM
jgi:hypothetical protein